MSNTTGFKDGNYSPISNVAISPGNGYVLPQAGGTVATDSATGAQYAPQLNAPVDGQKVTYSAVATGLATLGSAGVLLTLTGSASKTIRITRIEMSGIATSATTLEFVLNKYSTAATGGTAGTAPTIVAHDSTDAAATAAAAIYTAAPTAGTLVGAVRAAKVNLGTSAAAGQMQAWNFGDRPGARSLVLRGAAQQIGITTSAAASGSSVDIAVEWVEE
jgi:hypothetical protein